MLQLQKDSINRISANLSEMQMLTDWMDIGSYLNAKMRNDEQLDEYESALVGKLNALISSVALTEDIILYRGITNMGLSPNCVIKAPQFNSMAPLEDIALEYGDTMTVYIPAGTNCFYISAWENFSENVDLPEEKEILFPPGKFTYLNRNKDFIFHQESISL